VCVVFEGFGAMTKSVFPPQSRHLPSCRDAMCRYPNKQDTTLHAGDVFPCARLCPPLSDPAPGRIPEPLIRMTRLVRPGTPMHGLPGQDR